MKVNEIFESIQGEGLHIGCSALFIRLQGCNKHCSFCDTKYAQREGVDMRIVDIIPKIRHSSSPYVVFTGGEPMLQQWEIGNIIGTINEPPNLPKYFEVETNGTIRPMIQHQVNLFTVSPKDDFKIDRAYFDLSNVVFKFVIKDEEDLVKVESFTNTNHLFSSRYREKLFVMPQTITFGGHRRILPKLFAFAKIYPQFRVTPRLQILAYGNVRGI